MMFARKSLFAAFLLGLVAACGGSGGPMQEDLNTGAGDQLSISQPGGTVDSDQETTPDPNHEPDVTADNGSERESSSDKAETENNRDTVNGNEPETVVTGDPGLDEVLEGSEEEVIALVGVAVVVDPDTGNRILVRGDGEYRKTEGTRTFDRLAIVRTNEIPVSSDISSPFIGQAANIGGIIGIETDAAAIPVDGTATFIGGAVATVVLPDEGFDYVNGTSTVDVDFSAATVTATLDGFSVISQLGGKEAEAPPISAIILTDAAITGTGFSGGTVTTTGDMTLEGITGTDGVALAEGQFFGVDEDVGGPAEVGGLIYAEGSDGQIYGSFIAD